MPDQYVTAASVGGHETEAGRSRFRCALAPAAPWRPRPTGRGGEAAARAFLARNGVAPPRR